LIPKQPSLLTHRIVVPDIFTDSYEGLFKLLRFILLK